jgi:hypothetical protein
VSVLRSVGKLHGKDAKERSDKWEWMWDRGSGWPSKTRLLKVIFRVLIKFQNTNNLLDLWEIHSVWGLNRLIQRSLLFYITYNFSSTGLSRVGQCQCTNWTILECKTSLDLIQSHRQIKNELFSTERFCVIVVGFMMNIVTFLESG